MSGNPFKSLGCTSAWALESPIFHNGETGSLLFWKWRNTGSYTLAFLFSWKSCRKLASCTSPALQHFTLTFFTKKVWIWKNKKQTSAGSFMRKIQSHIRLCINCKVPCWRPLQWETRIFFSDPVQRCNNLFIVNWSLQVKQALPHKAVPCLTCCSRQRNYLKLKINLRNFKDISVKSLLMCNKSNEHISAYIFTKQTCHMRLHFAPHPQSLSLRGFPSQRAETDNLTAHHKLKAAMHVNCNKGWRC